MPEKPPFARERLQPGLSLPTSLSQGEQPSRSFISCVLQCPSLLSGSAMDPLQFSSLSLELGAQDRTLQHWPLSTSLQLHTTPPASTPLAQQDPWAAVLLDSLWNIPLSLLCALFPASENFVSLCGKGKSKFHGQNTYLWLRWKMEGILTLKKESVTVTCG